MSELIPETDELIIKEKDLSAVIVDAEIDPIKCSFNYSATVKLNTEGYTHVTLTVSNLYKLIELIEESEEWFDENL